MQSIDERIITAIAKRGRGKIIFPIDFAGYGNSKAAQKAFERLENSEQQIRVARGIYCYPKIDNELGLGVPHPTFEEIASAIARRDKAQIVPTGTYAMSRLGLSTQLPMNEHCVSYRWLTAKNKPSGGKGHPVQAYGKEESCIPEQVCNASDICSP